MLAQHMGVRIQITVIIMKTQQLMMVHVRALTMRMQSLHLVVQLQLHFLDVLEIGGIRALL